MPDLRYFRQHIPFCGVLVLYLLALVSNVTPFMPFALLETASACARRDAQECARPHLHSGHAPYYTSVIYCNWSVKKSDVSVARQADSLVLNQYLQITTLSQAQAIGLLALWHYPWTSEAKDKARRWHLQKSMKEWFPSKMFFQDQKRALNYAHSKDISSIAQFTKEL
jgi:hypothetical protein